MWSRTSRFRLLVEPLGSAAHELPELHEGRSRVATARVGKETLASMISLRELDAIGLPIARLGEFRHLIQYVQMENPLVREGARACPRRSDGFDYRPFLRALKGFGYSAEIGLPGDADADTLSYCRELAERASQGYGAGRPPAIGASYF